MDFIQPCQDVLAVNGEQPLAAWYHCRLWGLLEFHWHPPGLIEEVNTLGGVTGQMMEPLLVVVFTQLLDHPRGAVA